MNRISGSHQNEEPENFQGGIIADPMGLGKTLTMIALAASDLMCTAPAPRLTYAATQEGTNMGPVGQTLVVVPPPRRLYHDRVNGVGLLINHPTVLGTWEEQLEEWVYPV